MLSFLRQLHVQKSQGRWQVQKMMLWQLKLKHPANPKPETAARKSLVP